MGCIFDCDSKENKMSIPIAPDKVNCNKTFFEKLI